MTDRSETMPAPAAGIGRLCRRAWWVFLIGGIASIIFGILAFLNPAAALLVLSIFFAAYILVDGASNIWGAIQNRGQDGWIAVLLLGIVGVAVGGYALAVPPVSMIAFIYVISMFAMVSGVMSIYIGWKIREEISNEWILFTAGILSVLFALFIIFQPGFGSVAVVYMIASWAIATGALRVWFAFFIKNKRDTIVEKVADVAEAASE